MRIWSQLLKKPFMENFSFCAVHSVIPYHKNLQALVTEIFKVKNDLAPDIVKNVFGLKETLYNRWSESNYVTCRNAKTTCYYI